MKIIGCGNAERGDDAAGVMVARRLRELGIAASEHTGEAAGLLDAWEGAAEVVLVDAVVTGAPAGAVRVWDGRRAPVVQEALRASTHGFGVAEAIELGRVLGRLPPRLCIYGIEGKQFTPGGGMSPEVEQAVASVVRAIARVERLRVTLCGAVQGVGFRPFVYRLATELGLTGWVLNSSAGLTVEVEGLPERLGRFQERLLAEKPAAAVVLTWESSRLAPAGFTAFEIRESDAGHAKTAAVLPDLAMCPDCRREMLDPANRRFGYPFTNCTNCGPRFTIVEDIPYDRPATTMRGFTLCLQCRREYEDPRDRRFHAQPNACPVCGPRLSGTTIAEAAEALRAGRIVALKGIGGFQLLVDARQPEAVARLRERKHREEKPFALMVPSLEMARLYCEVSAGEQALMESPAAPIVLLRPSGRGDLAWNVAPHSPFLGVMLPYSPLHHLLMRECGFPVVATSGNRTDEPIATRNEEARERLGAIADLFVAHDRPIARPCDDSVVRLSRGRESVLRRARGYAPLPVRVRRELPAVLAVGGHLKNTIAIAIGRQVFLSQHIGDLETLEARGAFEAAIDDLCKLYGFRPELVACDRHPDYASTRWARASGLPVVEVQHHQAHAAACAAENDVQGAYLGVSWDGTGYGLDGTVWGGEFFLADGVQLERVAHLRPFRLPGGEAAVREGWRSAAGLRWEMGEREGIEPVIARMLERGVNAPVTTSVGRLFDAVAALAGVADRSWFEGQAAMMLEREIGDLVTDEAYPLPEGDWEPLLREVSREARRPQRPPQRPSRRLRSSESPARSPALLFPDVVAAKFHNALVGWIAEVAGRSAVRQVVLSGGVFQNRYLTERTAAVLEGRGFAVYTHQRVPPNDGGIALGQAVLAGGG